MFVESEAVAFFQISSKEVRWWNGAHIAISAAEFAPKASAFDIEALVEHNISLHPHDRYNIENKYSIAKVKSRSEYLTYIKDNTDNEYNPISNADIRGKAIKIFSAQSVIMYYSIVIICLIYLTVLIILNLNALKKNS